jgi:hypothetical protein
MVGGQFSEPDYSPGALSFGDTFLPCPAPTTAAILLEAQDVPAYCSFKSNCKMNPSHLFCRKRFTIGTGITLKSYQLYKMSFVVKCHGNKCPKVSLKNAAHTHCFYKNKSK